MENKPLFRELRADELQVRKGQTFDNKTRVSLLVYKDARVDANILDEVYGQFNWACQYASYAGVTYCGVGIKDQITGQFVWKWDAGGENENEKEKGTASDAFKRACFKWGIGRALYTCPRIVVANSNDSYKVTDIRYADGKVTHLTIVNQRGVVIFQMTPECTSVMSGPLTDPEEPEKPWAERLKDYCSALAEGTEDPDELVQIRAFYTYYKPLTNKGNKYGPARCHKYFTSDVREGTLVVDTADPKHPKVTKVK